MDAVKALIRSYVKHGDSINPLKADHMGRSSHGMSAQNEGHINLLRNIVPTNIIHRITFSYSKI